MVCKLVGYMCMNCGHTTPDSQTECPKCGTYRKEFKNGIITFYNKNGFKIGETEVIGHGETKKKEGSRQKEKGIEGRTDGVYVHEERETHRSRPARGR